MMKFVIGYKMKIKVNKSAWNFNSDLTNGVFASILMSEQNPEIVMNPVVRLDSYGY